MRTTPVSDAPPTPLRDFTAASEFLGVPEATLRKWVAQRLIPFTKIGRHVRFTDDHLRQIIANGEHVPATGDAA